MSVGNDDLCEHFVACAAAEGEDDPGWLLSPYHSLEVPRVPEDLIESSPEELRAAFGDLTPLLECYVRDEEELASLPDQRVFFSCLFEAAGVPTVELDWDYGFSPGNSGAATDYFTFTPEGADAKVKELLGRLEEGFWRLGLTRHKQRESQPWPMNPEPS